jgi:tRNA(His) guanylyltransferase
MSKQMSISDRMKLYEQPSISRVAFKGQPIVARLDGRSFHTFCKGLKRPYDERLSTLMRQTMMELVDRFDAKVGYTQSDEITLVWYVSCDAIADYPFNGRFQKMESLLASYCTAFFGRELMTAIPEKAHLLPTFDCRAFVVPTLQEAYHCLLWRQQDATKNAISMAAQSMFSHKQLQFLNGSQLQELMWRDKNVNFNDYHAFFKRGVFARRVREERMLTDEQLQRIPEAHRPVGPVTRSFVDAVDIWLTKQQDPVDALFNGGSIFEAPNPPVPTGVLQEAYGYGNRLLERLAPRV